MLKVRLISKYGTGAGTNYTTEKLTRIKTDVALTLNKKLLSKELILVNRHSFIAIKKIILTPQFDWKKPIDWSMELFKQQLELKITCHKINCEEIKDHQIVA